MDNQSQENPVQATTWLMLIEMWNRGLTTHLRAYSDEIIRVERRRRLNNIRPPIGNASGQGGDQESGSAKASSAKSPRNRATAIKYFISSKGTSLSYFTSRNL